MVKSSPCTVTVWPSAPKLPETLRPLPEATEALAPLSSFTESADAPTEIPSGRCAQCPPSSDPAPRLPVPVFRPLTCALPTPP